MASRGIKKPVKRAPKKTLATKAKDLAVGVGRAVQPKTPHPTSAFGAAKTISNRKKKLKEALDY